MVQRRSGHNWAEKTRLDRCVVPSAAVVDEVELFAETVVVGMVVSIVVHSRETAPVVHSPLAPAAAVVAAERHGQT